MSQSLLPMEMACSLNPAHWTGGGGRRRQAYNHLGIAGFLSLCLDVIGTSKKNRKKERKPIKCLYPKTLKLQCSVNKNPNQIPLP